MRKLCFVLLILFTTAFGKEEKIKEPFELVTKNVIGLHPVSTLIPVIFMESFGFETAYLRSFCNLDLLTRFTFLNDSFGEKSYDRILIFEVGVRKHFYPAYNSHTQFGPYLQVSAVNQINIDKNNTSSGIRKYRDVYLGALATAGLRFQRKRFILDLDIGIGPRYAFDDNEFDFNIQPNFMVGIAF